MSLSAIPKSLRAQIFLRDQGQCRYCRLMQVGQAAVFHINHIVPKSKGGATDASNLTLQCPYCSLHKSNKVSANDPDTGSSTALFHPLLQSWQEHFTIDSDGTCFGITPIGRATVKALHMNDPLSRIARGMQIRLGLIKIK